MMIVYEVGTLYFTADVHRHTETRIKAFDYMLRFFQWFGIGSKYWPPLAVAAILLVWHRAHKYSWELDFGTVGCMGLESIVWCLPLFVLDGLSKTYVPLQATLQPSGWLQSSLSEMMVLAVGAGVYEELVFRLGSMTLLSLLFENLFQMHRGWAILLMVVVSALMFAGYHYQPGGESFSYQTFAFRTAAGIYFGVLFWRRGFGITCGTHAAYDIMAVLLPTFAAR
jgi:hypothetical protein